MCFAIVMQMRAMAQCPGYHLERQGSAEIPATVNKMTNIVFPTAIRSGVKVSRYVSVQKVRGVENVIELRAIRKGFETTNLSVYGVDGRLYSFLVRSVDEDSLLNFRVVRDSVGMNGVGCDLPDGEAEIERERLGRLKGSRDLPDGPSVILSGLPANKETLRETAVALAAEKSFLRRSTRSDRLRLTLTGVYFRNGLEWLVFAVRNGSRISWEPAYTRFFLEDRRRVKSMAVQDVSVNAVFGEAPGVVKGSDGVSFAIGFKSFAVPHGKRLVIQMAGEDGGRVVELRVKGGVLLRARE